MTPPNPIKLALPSTERIIDAPWHSLVRVWYILHHNDPVLQSDAVAMAGLPRAGEDLVEEILDALTAEDPLPSEAADHPLALIRAIDEYLVREVRYRQEGPTPLVEAHGEKFWVHRLAGPRPPWAAFQRRSIHLQHWLRLHWIVPRTIRGREIEIAQAERPLADALATWGDESVPVYIATFEDDAELTLDLQDPDDPHSRLARASGLSDEDARWEVTIEHLERARDEQAELVLFPELTLTENLRGRISTWLFEHESDHRIKLLLPGSFHIEENGVWSNHACLVDGRGERVSDHRKLAAYQNDHFIEHIQPSSEVKVLSSPAGILAIAICLDFCNSDGPFQELWMELGPDWVLVPAMDSDPALSPFEICAHQLQIKHGSISLVANQPPAGRKASESSRAVFVAHGESTHSSLQGSLKKVRQRPIEIKL